MSRSRKIIIQEYVAKKTQELIFANNLDHSGVSASDASSALFLDRSNTSRILNKLWKDGHLIKIEQRPVLFLDSDSISSYYKHKYIPSTVDRGLSISFYLEKKRDTFQKEIDEDSFSTLIGAEGSLKDEIRKAKAAILYPPYGLHTLIIGNTGVGKTEIALNMVKLAKTKRDKYHLPFFVIQCQNYSNNYNDFFKILLGYKDENHDNKFIKGLLERYKKGIIIFENLMLLSQKSIDLLNSIIKNNSFSRIGSNNEQVLETMFIGTSTRNDKLNNLITETNPFPIKIQLPDIDKRGTLEKLELILYHFSREARNINYLIKVHKDIITCFLEMDYPQNIRQLENEIKQTCSKAFLDSSDLNRQIIEVNFHNLSNSLLERRNKLKKGDVSYNSLFSTFESEILEFKANGNSNLLKDHLDEPLFLSNARNFHIIKRFTTDISLLENSEEYIYKSLEFLKTSSEFQQQAIIRNVNPIIINSVKKILEEHDKYREILEHFYLFYGFLFHISSLYTKSKENLSKSLDKELMSLERSNAIEFNLIIEIFNQLGILTSPYISNKIISFFTFYLSTISQLINKDSIGILVICHGDNIAKEMINYVKHALTGELYLDAIDYNENMQFNDLLESACFKTIELNQGRGVIILSDIYPLTSINDYVTKETGIQSLNVSPISLPILMEIAEKSRNKANDIINLSEVAHVDGITISRRKIKNDDFLTRIINEIVQKTVTFIDVNKAADILLDCLDITLKSLDIFYSDEIAIKYLTHSINMLERVIKKETWNYDKLSQFTKENFKIMQNVEKGLNIANNYYGIRIPTPEIAYIAEIFLF